MGDDEETVTAIVLDLPYIDDEDTEIVEIAAMGRPRTHAEWPPPPPRPAPIHRRARIYRIVVPPGH